jgi:hypothetical protein
MADKETIEYLKEASKLRKDAEGELKRLTDLLMSQKGISEATARIEAKKEKTYKDIVDQLKEVNSQVKELRDAQKEVVGSLMQEEQKLKSLTGLQQSIAGIERRKLDLFAKQNSMHENQKDAFGRISELNKELLELSAEDKISRAEISRQIEHELEQLREKGKRQDGLGEGSRELLALMEEEYSIATRVSNMTEGQQKQLEAQLEVYEDMKKSVGGVLDTLSLLTSNINAAVGALFVGVGSVANKFGDVNKELGSGFSLLNKTNLSAGVLSFIFEDTAGTVKALTSEFGDASVATFSLQTNVGLIAKNMGISNTEAASLVGSFARLNGGSTDIASDMVKTTQQFAKQNGIIPSTLMADLASSAEEFALYGKDGGQNILKAAGYAQKLGVSMKTLTGIADNLLDFESSITKELELGAMLGKNINLNQARQLAYAGDIEGATKETLRALGGAAAFNDMDYFEKKAAADLLGTSVAEMEKMVKNQEAAGSMGSVINEKFSKMNELLDTGLNQYLGTGLQGLGGMITMSGQLGMGFKSLGLDMGGMVKNTALILKNLLGMVAGPVLNGLKSVGSFIGGSSVGQTVGGGIGKIKDRLLQGTTMAPTLPSQTPTSPTLPSTPKAEPSSIAEKMSKIDGKKLMQSAGALLILAGALFVFAKALQQFKDVGIEELGMAAGSLLILGGALFGLSMLLAPLAASGILYMVAAGMLAFGAAMFLVGAGVKLFSDGIATLGGVLPTMVDPLLQLSQINFLPILGLAASLGVLAVALSAVALSGLLALPILAGLGLIAGGFGLFGEGEGGAETTDRTGELIDEIKGLRSDLNSGKIAVYVDGRKVTSSVSRVADKVSTNSYGL